MISKESMRIIWQVDENYRVFGSVVNTEEADRSDQMSSTMEAFVTYLENIMLKD